MTTYDRCPRCWWFAKIHKLPEPKKSPDPTVLGDIGHAVIERYLRGEELYPEGWEKCIDRWKNTPTGQSIDKGEQALVRQLVKAGIEQGVVNIEPDGVVEKECRVTLDSSFSGIPVQLLGYLDYATPATVIDHKFCKSIRYYGEAKLKKALPMNLYAMFQYLDGTTPEDSNIWLRYNLFVKDAAKPRVKHVHVERRPQDVLGFYNSVIVPLIEGMAKLKSRNVPLKAWANVEGSETKRNACSAFGGCPYLSVCDGRCHPEDYLNRFAKKGDESKTPETGKKKGGSKMNFLQKATQAAEQKEAETPPPAPVETETPEAPAEAPVSSEEQLTAPWYFDGCTACSDSPIRGLKTNMSVCRVCSIRTKQAGGPLAGDYKIDVTEEGGVLITKDGEVVLQKGTVEVPVTETVAPVEKETPKENPTDAVGPTEADAPEPPPAADPPPPAPAKKKAAAKKAPAKTEEAGEGLATDSYEQERTGFTLSYVPVRQRKRTSKKIGEANCIVHIGELLDLVATNLLPLANEAGTNAESFFDVQVFTRRDLIARNSRAIAGLLGNSTLEATTVQKGSDEAHICAAIEQYAGLIYGGLE